MKEKINNVVQTTDADYTCDHITGIRKSADGYVVNCRDLEKISDGKKVGDNTEVSLDSFAWYPDTFTQAISWIMIYGGEDKIDDLMRAAVGARTVSPLKDHAGNTR